MMKLLDKLLLLLLIAIINYPSASLSVAGNERVCRVSNYCIGWDYCGWTLYGYRKSCCVNERCVCKESIWDSEYCPDFVIRTEDDFRHFCNCYPSDCYYKDDNDKMIMKCLGFIGENASKRDALTWRDRGWWNEKIMMPPING